MPVESKEGRGESDSVTGTEWSKDALTRLQGWDD